MSLVFVVGSFIVVVARVIGRWQVLGQILSQQVLVLDACRAEQRLVRRGELWRHSTGDSLRILDCWCFRSWWVGDVTVL